MKLDAPAATRRQLVAVVCLGLVARAVAAWLAQPSDDLLGWRWVADVLLDGRNPYVETPRLNWPPLWMLWLGAVGWVSAKTGLAFGALVRLLPFAADAATTALLGRLSLPLAVCYALHPVPLAITGTQAQLDAVPALCALVAVLAVTTRVRHAAALAGVALGVGAGFKTWPVWLAPPLALRLRERRPRLVLLSLAIGIPAVTLMPLVLFAYEGFLFHVVRYRSWPGWWGLTALGTVIRRPAAQAFSAAAAEHGAPVLLGGIALSWLLALRLSARDAAIATVLTFLVLTPGFGPQYLLWLVPLSLIAHGRWRTIWNVVAMASTVGERLLVPWLVPGYPEMPAVTALVTNFAVNAVRLPLWLVSIGWLLTLVRRALSPPPRPAPPAAD